MHNLFMKMYDDQSLFDLYYAFYWKSYVNGRTCIDQCKIDMLCEMRTAVAGDPCPQDY